MMNRQFFIYTFSSKRIPTFYVSFRSTSTKAMTPKTRRHEDTVPMKKSDDSLFASKRERTWCVSFKPTHDYKWDECDATAPFASAFEIIAVTSCVGRSAAILPTITTVMSCTRKSLRFSFYIDSFVV